MMMMMMMVTSYYAPIDFLAPLSLVLINITDRSNLIQNVRL